MTNTNFYIVPKGYFQILNEMKDYACKHDDFVDSRGYTFSNGKTSIIRDCESCGSQKKFSSYIK